MKELVVAAPQLFVTELDSISSLCFRALDGSNYDVRCDVAKVLGTLLAHTQQPKTPQQQGRIIVNLYKPNFY